MNILASYNWIRESVATDLDAREFARRLSLSGPSVERIHPQSAAFEKMVVGVIKGVRPHPDADKLRLVDTDIGTAGGVVEIVCGGSNLAPGMKVAVAMEGAKVRWHGEGEPIELKPTKIRGVMSNGMICGANEIGLGEAFPHAEKEILDLGWCEKAAAGMPLAEALDADDTVFDIEVTTNRPDAFCMVGLAREAAAILDARFTWEEPALPKTAPKDAVALSVKNDASDLCARYQAVVMDGVKVAPSPWWLKNRLRMAGIRPVNNIVDIGNYVMLELGQPMHAFDHATLRGGAIVVREAKEGEVLAALDGKIYALAPGQLVIADAERPVAVAGIMGGEETGVRDATTTIVFESATFDPLSVRRTGRALDLHSDSSTRFEKGLPEEQTAPALARAIRLCEQLAGGRVASKVVDVRGKARKPVSFTFRPEKARTLIGADISDKRMVAILESLGFEVEGKKGAYKVTVPYWRARDIEDERDFSEEIARIHGYHALPSVLPVGALAAAAPAPILQLEDATRSFLHGAGYTEIFTYSFVSREEMEKAKRDPEKALRVANPLSSDFEFMRTCLVPGTLSVIARNEGLFPSAMLFEVSNVYKKREGDLPEERPRVIAAVYGPDKDGRQFSRCKGLLETYLPRVGVRDVALKRSDDAERWHPGRTVEVQAGGRVLGKMGEVHPEILAAVGINGRVAIMQLELDEILAVAAPGLSYEQTPQFPAVLRDLAVVVDERVEYAAIDHAARTASRLISEVRLFDVYQGKGLPTGKKSVAVHLEFTAPDRTLRSEEVDVEMERIVAALGGAVGATVRS